MMPNTNDPNATGPDAAKLFPKVCVFVETINGHHHGLTFLDTPAGRMEALQTVMTWAQEPDLNFGLIDAARWCKRIRATGPLIGPAP